MSMPSLSIRRARPADIEILVSLRGCLLDGASATSYASRNAEESELWKAAYRSWLLQVVNVDERIRIFVADSGGEVVGCATGVIDRRPPAPDCMTGWCGWVQSVVVARQWRRQGVGRQLMVSVLRWFSEQNAAKVILESTPDANALYVRLGFTASPESLLSYTGGRSCVS